MAEQIRAEEGAIEKGATAVDNARSGIENRIKDIEAKMAELGFSLIFRITYGVQPRIRLRMRKTTSPVRPSCRRCLADIIELN